MHDKLLPLLACPECWGALSLVAVRRSGDTTEEGSLTCAACGMSYPIRGSIPRFVPAENYGDSFGLQWDRFRTVQLDSYSGVPLSEERFRSETGWSESDLQGAWLMEGGSGAGRFLEIAAKMGADVVGVDISAAVDAAHKTLGHLSNVHFVQASLFKTPFKDGAFHRIYCLGVLQHTPTPLEAFSEFYRVLMPGGSCAVTVYERRRFTALYSKYLLRHLTKRVPPHLLLAAIERLMPVLFGATDVLFRLPLAGRLFRFAVPVANYTDEPRLSREQRFSWAVLDTFDALAPEFDSPQREPAVRAAMSRFGFVSVERRPARGLVVRAQKPTLPVVR